MISVSNNSWHYRLRASVFDGEPKDLCSYFWSCVAAVLAHVIMFGARLLRPLGRYGGQITIGLCILLIIILITKFVIAIIDDPWNALWIPLGILGVVVGLGIIVVGVLGALELHDRRTKKRSPSEKKRSPSEKPRAARTPRSHTTFQLIWAFLKAKKRKACPLIEVQHEEP